MMRRMSSSASSVVSSVAAGAGRVGETAAALRERLADEAEATADRARSVSCEDMATRTIARMRF